MNNKTRGILSAIGCIFNTGFSYCTTNMVTLLMVPMMTATGCSKTQAVMVYTMLSVGGLFATFFLGPLMNKIHPKILFAVLGLNYVIFFGLMGMSTNIYVILVGGFIWGIGAKALGSLSYSIVVNQWFATGRQTITSCVGIVNSVFTAILAPVLATLVSSMGFSKVCLVFGIAASGFTAAFSILCLSKSPEHYGMEPIHFGKDKPKKAGKMGAGDVYESVMPMSRLTKDFSFWLILLPCLLLTLANQLYTSNRTLIFSSLGMTTEQTATIISVVSLASAIMWPVFGLMCDTFGPKFSLITFMSIACASFLLLPHMNFFIGCLIVSITINTCGLGSRYGQFSLPRLYGRKKAATMLSWAASGNNIGAIVAPTLSAAIAEAAGGSYAISLGIGAVIQVICIAITVYCMSDKAVEKIKEIDAPYIEAAKNA